MFARSHVTFGVGVGCRCCHIAKRADGIYRFIWIDAVEELDDSVTGWTPGNTGTTVGPAEGC